MTVAPEQVEARSRRGRILGFVALCVVCVAVAVGYVAHTSGRGDRKVDAAGAVAAGAPTAASVMAQPHLLVRDMATGQAGYAGVLPLSDTGGARAVTHLPCPRPYMAGGNGICLSHHRDI